MPEVFAYCSILTGLVLPVLAFLHIRAVEAQRGWPNTIGTILRSDVVYESEGYIPVVEYSYTVDGVAYRGDRVRTLLVQHSSRGPASAVARKFFAGATVVVYFDPTKPNSAVLEPGADKAVLLLACGVATILVVVGAAMLLA